MPLAGFEPTIYWLLEWSLSEFWYQDSCFPRLEIRIYKNVQWSASFNLCHQVTTVLLHCANYAHLNTTDTPGFSDLPTALTLEYINFDQNSWRILPLWAFGKWDSEWNSKIKWVLNMLLNTLFRTISVSFWLTWEIFYQFTKPFQIKANLKSDILFCFIREVETTITYCVYFINCIYYI